MVQFPRGQQDFPAEILHITVRGCGSGLIKCGSVSGVYIVHFDQISKYLSFNVPTHVRDNTLKGKVGKSKTQISKFYYIFRNNISNFTSD